MPNGNSPSGVMSLLLLSLLAEGDKYGYEMIEALDRRSDHTFDLKAGTLYPLLHDLEKAGAIHSYTAPAEGKRVRRYYGLTQAGRGLLAEKRRAWEAYAQGVERVLEGGVSYVLA